MQKSSKPKTDWILGGLLLTLFLLSLTGCASSPRVVPCEKVQTPAAWSEPQLPGANDFSNEARTLLLDVQTYFSEMPQFTTQSSEH